MFSRRGAETPRWSETLSALASLRETWSLLVFLVDWSVMETSLYTVSVHGARMPRDRSRPADGLSTKFIALGSHLSGSFSR